MHWPSPRDAVPMAASLPALAQARQQGLTRQIGLSNVTIALTRQAIAILGAEAIATQQIEVHPYLHNRKLIGFLREQGIHVTSYMTLAYRKVLQDPVIAAIAARHAATPAQVALAWALQHGYAVIPSSTKRENLASNLRAVAAPGRAGHGADRHAGPRRAAGGSGRHRAGLGLGLKPGRGAGSTGEAARPRSGQPPRGIAALRCPHSAPVSR